MSFIVILSKYSKNNLNLSNTIGIRIELYILYNIIYLHPTCQCYPFYAVCTCNDWCSNRWLYTFLYAETNLAHSKRPEIARKDMWSALDWRLNKRKTRKDIVWQLIHALIDIDKVGLPTIFKGFLIFGGFMVWLIINLRKISVVSYTWIETIFFWVCIMNLFESFTNSSRSFRSKILELF